MEELFYTPKKQMNSLHSVTFALDPNSGSLSFSWNLQSTSSEISLGNTLNNNQWHTVNLQYRLGTVTLSVGDFQTTVAEENGLNSNLLDLDVVDSGMYVGVQRLGDDYQDYFTGCIREGPSMLLSKALSSTNVLWGQCPLNVQVGCDDPSDVDQCASHPCINGGKCVDLDNAFRCDCPSRYSGLTCGVDTGPLCDKPDFQLDCQNGGFCKEEDNGNYTACQCPSGYEGRYCEVSDIDYCAPDPCQNDGICRNNTYHDGFQCTCQKGFAGINCEININECYGDPCQNNGDCIDGIDIYTCNCTDTGYEGVHCETDINECERYQPCKNGAPCFNTYGDYSCQCMSGFDGKNCDQELDPCVSSPCANGAICSASGDFYVCDCAPGFTGVNCQTDVDECASDPCSPPYLCEDGVNSYACVCPPGKQDNGADCIDIDECLSSPCQNGATCQNGNNMYVCNCQPGYEGDRCDQEQNECASDPCLNGGVCKDQFNAFRCVCQSGYTGTQCETDINECESQPCYNNATCVDEINGYRCYCVPGYTDERCRLNIDECESNPCQNGATCQNEIAKYVCACPAGFEGINCETDIDECNGNPCQNGGTCVDGVNEFICNCTPLWMGDTCEEPYNACIALTPCQNGATCTTTAPSQDYDCNCVSGFEGDNCESNIDDCIGVTCPTGQVCQDLIDNHECSCPEGFEGETCNLETDECASSPCQNGATCIDMVGQYHCNCTEGYEGVNCDVDFDNCASTPCKNQALCVDSLNGYQCYCLPGFHGDDCGADIDECLSDPCKNGATCVQVVGEYECQCAPGFEGELCEIDIDECASDPCQNNATCVDQVNGYQCDCVPGFNGTYCEFEIDECESNPCKNGGRCTDKINSFSCDCEDTGFNGDLCEINIDDCLNVVCQNGGTCSDGIKNYVCLCYNGYLGKDCQTDFDDCAIKPCLNGAVCLQRSNQSLYENVYFDGTFSYDAAEGFECQCQPGFEGRNCETNIDECESSPCQNGGYCQDLNNGYECQCTPGWMGTHCEQEIDECLSGPCQNGGSCTDKFNGYECQCTSEYGGVHCSVLLIGCSSGSSCQNGASCVPFLQDEENNIHNYTCSCLQGYTGYYCQVSTSASYDGQSYMKDTSTNNKNSVDFKLGFRTTVPSGVLLYSGEIPESFGSFIVELSEGKVYARFSTTDNFIDTDGLGENLNDASWHHIQVMIFDDLMTLQLHDDGCNAGTCEHSVNISTVLPTNQRQFDSTFVGGVDATLAGWLANSRSQQNFIGCTRDVINEGQYLLPSEQSTVTSGCTRIEQCNPDPCSGKGDCVDGWIDYQCFCNHGFTGPNCNYNFTAITLSFEHQNSYLLFEVPPVSGQRAASQNVELNFRTTKRNGLLFFLTNSNQDQYIMLQLADGQIEGVVEYGSGSPLSATLGRRLADGKSHYLTLMYEETDSQAALQVEVDGQMMSSVSQDTGAAVDFTHIYVGGVPDFSTFSVSSVGNEYFKGCVQDVRHNDYLLDAYPLDIPNYQPGNSYRLISNMSLVEDCVSDDMCDEDNPCQNNSTCTTTWNDFECACVDGFRGKDCGLLAFCKIVTCPFDAECVDRDDGFDCVTSATFNGQSSEVTYTNSISQSSVIDTMLLNLRTRATDQLILHSTNNQGHYMTFELYNDNLMLHFNFGSGVEEVSTTNTVSDGEWHQIDIKFQSDSVELYVDGNLATSNAMTVPSLSGFFIATDNRIHLANFGPSGLVNSGNNFKGCFDEIRIGEFLLPFFDRETLSSNSTEQFYASPSDIRIGCYGDPVCDSSPCQNGATCEDIWNSYVCDCQPGYDGTNCENDIDECASTPCLFGATCQDRVNNYTCVCAPGYESSNCGIEINECESSPCQNNGTCEDLVDDFYCNCTSNYTGKHCEYLIPLFQSCDDEPCQNEATCVNVTAENPSQPSFECICRGGYEGVYCQSEIDYCENVTCQNNGMCFSHTDLQMFVCTCQPGYEGVYCEVDIDECIGVQCLNGATCKNLINRFDCACLPGYDGVFCGNDIDECANVTCENGGTCVDRVNEFECQCREGYEGVRCETEGPCVEKPCLNGGTCEQWEPYNATDYNCTCPIGYEGVHCQNETDWCEIEPCENGGTCNNFLTGYNCTCAPTWTGDVCTETYCDDNPCENNSTCQNLDYGYECNCTAGFNGTNCEIDIDECLSNPCLNGGVCIDRPGYFVCNCTGTGFEGSNCENDINECDLIPPVCENDGECTNEPAGSYTCKCSDQYIGNNCQHEDPCYEIIKCENGGTCDSKLNETNHPIWICNCTEDYIGSLCEIVPEPVTEDNNLFLIIGAALGGLVFILFIVLVVFLCSVRSKRATRGTYSPSRQEMTGSRVEMGNVLKPPPEERLI
ncbi:protein crumbs-like isoform X2 [Ptychodera flava]|uniref:protein crumbs-like isoform X2 n=1 Tax=Ptychodera flava TaxID=63121 RepID=UPI00396A5F4A